MKFTKFGKALLMSALSAGVMLSVTSCVQSYSIGYLYVTGTSTNGSSSENGNGIITGFDIDHNTGKLTLMRGLPISSGGANPVRAVLTNSSRFLYVLNRGANKEGNDDCTTNDPCLNPNITLFAVGGNGILTPQETFYTQGVNPFRLIADSTGAHIYVLDHDSPAATSTNSNPVASTNNPICKAVLSGATTCGDITAFTADATTGRLSLLANQAATPQSTSTVPYFPVPSNPVDFVLSGSYILTLNSTTAQTSSPYTGGSTVLSYAYASTTGQLTVPYPQTLKDGSATGVPNGTAIISSGGVVYVLDNNPILVNGSVASQSQILPYTSIGTNGVLNAAISGNIPDDATQSNPISLLAESKGKWFYVANQGGGNPVNPNPNPSVALSGIAGYVINSPYQPTEISGTPIGFNTGSSPQCLVEDPSNQYIYTANGGDSTVTGQSLDENAGTLVPLVQSTHAASSYSLTGPATWCLIDGRTN
jgi:6-phosphogluconolactonase (cycloisomerase 2 family)